MFKNIDKKMIIIGLALVFLILGLAWLILFWQSQKIRELSENYQKEKLNSFVLQEKRDRLAQLKKEIVNLEEGKSSLSAMFIKKDQALPLLEALERVAVTSYCQIVVDPADISKIKFQQTAPAPKNTSDDETAAKPNNQTNDQSAKPKAPDEIAQLKNFPAFTLTVTGSYSGLVDFLSQMENLPYFIRPLTFDVIPVVKNQSQPQSVVAQPAGDTGSGPLPENPEEKTVKATINIVIYGN